MVEHAIKCKVNGAVNIPNRRTFFGSGKPSVENVYQVGTGENKGFYYASMDLNYVTVLTRLNGEITVVDRENLPNDTKKADKKEAQAFLSGAIKFYSEMSKVSAFVNL